MPVFPISGGKVRVATIKIKSIANLIAWLITFISTPASDQLNGGCDLLSSLAHPLPID